MSSAALVLYVAGLLVVFGGRTWLHVRRTGRSGFHGISGPRGSLRWWAGVLFVLALVLGVIAPVLAVSGVVPVVRGFVAEVVSGVGLVVTVVGFVAVLVAQSGMGESWRIGVERGERTELVTHGVFSLVRNPVFTAMVTTQAGIALMVPTVVSVLALVCLVTAVQLQVRLIEEPHLRRVHGARYDAYAARTGRFLPTRGGRRS